MRWCSTIFVYFFFFLGPPEAIMQYILSTIKLKNDYSIVPKDVIQASEKNAKGTLPSSSLNAVRRYR